MANEKIKEKGKSETTNKKRPSRSDMAIKQELAKNLYLKEKLDQKVIAQRIGVTEKTISKWVTDNNWEKTRRNLLISKDALFNSYLDALDDLNKDIAKRDEGKRYATSSEADIIVKYTAAIRSMETELCIADIVGAGTRFIKYLQSVCTTSQVTEFLSLWDAFVYQVIKNK